MILVGDGSGSKYGYPIGWGCVALERDAMERRVFHGAANDGTVNIAELMAYLIPLTWYAAKVAAHRKSSNNMDVRQVHIITDSQYIAELGKGKSSVTERAHTILWAAFELIQRKGIRLNWHWIARETAPLNEYVDALSKAARFGLTDSGVMEAAIVGSGLTPDTANPWE